MIDHKKYNKNLVEKLALVNEGITSDTLGVKFGFQLASDKHQKLVDKTSAKNMIFGTEFKYKNIMYRCISITKKNKTLFPSFLVKDKGNGKYFVFIHLGGTLEDELKSMNVKELKSAIDLANKVALREEKGVNINPDDVKIGDEFLMYDGSVKMKVTKIAKKRFEGYQIYKGRTIPIILQKQMLSNPHYKNDIKHISK